MSLEGLQVSVAELAGLLGITERRVQQLADEGCLVKAVRGSYDLAGSVQGYLVFLRKQLPNTGKPTESAERTRLLKAKAGIAELEEQQRRGELGRVDEMERTAEQEARTALAALLVIGARIGEPLSVLDTPEACEALVDKEIRKACEVILAAAKASAGAEPSEVAA